MLLKFDNPRRPEYRIMGREISSIIDFSSRIICFYCRLRGKHRVNVILYCRVHVQHRRDIALVCSLMIDCKVNVNSWVDHYYFNNEYEENKQYTG